MKTIFNDFSLNRPLPRKWRRKYRHMHNLSLFFPSTPNSLPPAVVMSTKFCPFCVVCCCWPTLICWDCNCCCCGCCCWPCCDGNLRIVCCCCWPITPVCRDVVPPPSDGEDKFEWEPNCCCCCLSIFNWCGCIFVAVSVLDDCVWVKILAWLAPVAFTTLLVAVPVWPGPVPAPPVVKSWYWPLLPLIRIEFSCETFDTCTVEAAF